MSENSAPTREQAALDARKQRHLLPRLARDYADYFDRYGCAADSDFTSVIRRLAREVETLWTEKSMMSANIQKARDNLDQAMNIATGNGRRGRSE